MSSIASFHKISRSRFLSLSSTDVDLGAEFLEYGWSGYSMIDMVIHLEELDLLESSSWPPSDESDQTAFVFDFDQAKKCLPKLRKYQPPDNELIEACLSDCEEQDRTTLLASYRAAVAAIIEALGAIDVDSIVILQIG